MTTTDKSKPAFYVFAQQDGKTTRIGAMFKHKNGDGYNLLINGARYSVFPPKAKPEQEGSA